MRAPADPSRPSYPGLGSRRVSPQRSRRRRAAAPAGFSFVEVLFAVMILGIGFIMVAAIFPMAIQQTHTASDESVSASVAWNALNVIQSKFSDAELPPVGAPSPYLQHGLPGVLRSFRDPQAKGVATLTGGQYAGRDKYTTPKGGGVVDTDPKNQITYAQPSDYLWNRVKGESVVVDDRRFAWVGFYRRHLLPGTLGDPAPYAQVVIVVARARESSAYGTRDVTEKALANLQPRPVRFYLTTDGTGPKVEQLVTFTNGDASEKGAVAEGAYLVVAHDKLFGDAQGVMNCAVFRIGNHVTGDTWELSPDAEFEPPRVGDKLITGLNAAEGYVIGRSKVGSAYEGVAQDVAVYTMLIPVQ
jgi:type II secretory pathway pseudopilin PulG